MEHLTIRRGNIKLIFFEVSVGNRGSIISEYELIEIRILFLIKQDCYVYVTLLLSRGHIYGSPAVI